MQRVRVFSTALMALATALSACGGGSTSNNGDARDGASDATRVDDGSSFDGPPSDTPPLDGASGDGVGSDGPARTDENADGANDSADTRGDAGPLDAITPRRCGSDTECASSEVGAVVCDTATGRCVDCTPTNRGSCLATQYCDNTNRCALGCGADTDCTGMMGRCELTRHVCVRCTADSHCPAGMVCMGNACVEGCSATHACPTGQSCCGGACLNTQSDPEHCGSCTTTCTGRDNASPTCRTGACSYTCIAGFGDCDGMAPNGCETNLDANVMHCGACGNACPAAANGTASCTRGACGFACAPNFANCDGVADNGCEVNLQTNASHCGACGRMCPNGANAVGSCAAGACTLRCLPGFADCDGDASNGCEAPLNTATNCGACGRACSGATPVCTTGGVETGMMSMAGEPTCASGCPAGQTRCGSMCVDVTIDVNNCGACGTACPASTNSTRACTAGRCSQSCTAGFLDCDGDASNGCEANTQVSTAHCGACGSACMAGANATATCAASMCRTSCTLGFGDCDRNEVNGCEVNLNTAVAHCGSCGHACPSVPNATPTCAAATCGFTCNAGFADCDGDATNGCEAPLNTVANCGMCGNACGGATPVCNGTTCVSGCSGTQARCGSTCTDTQTDVTNCGGCGNDCPTGPNATRVCATGTCSITCGSGYGNCNAVASDGCEENLNTSVAHCGACNRSCAATESCQLGVCTPLCPAGQTYCSGACRNTQNDSANCGACGTMCPAGQQCAEGMCRPGHVGTITMGNDHTCAIRGTGTVACWGLNTYGQLGDGSMTSRTLPVAVLGVNDAVEIAASSVTTYARRANGTVLAWGYNGAGDLGDGTTVSRPTAMPVLGLTNVVELAGGYAHACARLADGTVRCWGSNSNAQLGDGTAGTVRTMPTAVMGLTNAAGLCAGYLHTCARLTDGTVRCWGYNNYGALGDGTQVTRQTPVPVMGLTNVAQIACNTYSTCAVLTTGAVRCWGFNNHGQLGEGTTATRYTPNMVAGIDTAVEIASGQDVYRLNGTGAAGDRVCVRLASGSVQCWGYNNYGGLGDGTIVERRIPVAVMGLTNAIELSATGRYHTCARRADRSVVCWGYNANGQIGDGTTTLRPTPTPVSGLP